ncbi:MAG TPA: DUF1846 domain-containing protein [Candidatus Omnitrophica bacterium]|nr:DUF1846 domain-containing protein [Candidatus Omnitrophota bacterium]
MKEIGFDNDKYLEEQSAAILDRIENSGGRLYLEFGGKLLYDYHAARVLPGYDPNVKIRLLQRLKDKAQIILCIYAGHIEKKKIRADFGFTYDVDVLKMVDDLEDWGLSVSAIVITRFEGQALAKIFKNKLQRRNLPVYTHSQTEGYPGDVETVVSDKGYGVNEYIEVQKPLVIVAAPGPGSGKLATCLSQLYHEYKRGAKAGYAKFETFPIWNISLEHPVNIAYEAATADIGDYNLLDPFHLKAYKEESVNYNRDIETFPILERILEKITNCGVGYKSPTDMGVNRCGFGITNDEIVQEAARQEIIRRYFRYKCEYMLGLVEEDVVKRVEQLMDKAGVKEEDRKVVRAARAAAEEAKVSGKGHKEVFCGAAIELSSGEVVVGKNSPLMHAASSVVLNAVKTLTSIPDKIHLLSPNIIETIKSFKKNIMDVKSANLNLEETLIALSISAATNPAAQSAVENLKQLKGCEIHITYMPTAGDESGLRSLALNLTSDANFSPHSLYLV